MMETFTYAEKGVTEKQTTDTASIVFTDNFWQSIYKRATGNNVDYDALKNKLKVQGADNKFYYFFQRSQANDRVYETIENILNSDGWIVKRPLKEEVFENTQYSYFCEGIQLASTAMYELCQNEENYEHIKFTFLINHLYYLPFLHNLKEEVNRLKLRGVLNKGKANEDLLHSFDEVVHMFNLEVSHE